MIIASFASRSMSIIGSAESCRGRMTVRRIVVDRVVFVVEDLGASRRLYTAALAPVGYIELHMQGDVAVLR